VNKIWLQEEEQLEEKQQEEELRKKPEEQREGKQLEEEGDAWNKGIYSLVIKFDRDNSIVVGKLGPVEFPKGYYVYAGSALNYLDKRILRHKIKKKKLHWHVDYFLKHAKIIKVFTHITTLRLECELNKRIQVLPNARIIIKGFGCSDCKCSSHLTFFGNNNPNKDIEKIISGRITLSTH